MTNDQPPTASDSNISAGKDINVGRDLTGRDKIEIRAETVIFNQHSMITPPGRPSSAVSPELPALSHQPLTIGNPFFTGGRIHDPQMFFGRERLIREMQVELSKRSSVALVGESQIGKSSLLYYLYATSAAWLSGGTVKYVDLQRVLNESDFCETVLRELGAAGDSLSDLKRVLENRSVILLFDEVERLAEPDFNPRLHDLLRSLAQEREKLTLCLATQRPLEEVILQRSPSGVSSFHNIFSPQTLGPFTEAEARAFLTTRLSSTHIVFHEREIAYLWAQSLGHPAKLQRLAKALFDDKAERVASTYAGIHSFEQRDEVEDSFAAIAIFLEAQDIEALAEADQKLGWINSLAGPLLRPAVVEALKALGDVSQETVAYMRITRTAQKSASLNRAAGALNELAGYIEKEVKPPERVLLKRVVQLWQSIIAIEQGKLGEAALREMTPTARRAAGTAVERTSAIWGRHLTAFDNPYVAGNPVAPPLFVGRTDIFNRIGDVWSAKRVPDSIILYGQRRMGKSSILRNLNQAAPPESVIVYADMAGETSFVESTPDLLLGLADKICTALQSLASFKGITRPDPAAYNGLSSAAREFNRFTEQVRAALDGQALILALDEFEAVERAVEAGKIGKEIYQFLRAKTQEPWITLVLGGLHTLDEMSRDYQQPFYGSYENIRVSYLAHADAWRLITNPTEDFVLNYEPEAVERLIAETGGQPYLVQQVCRDALDHLNHELIDERRERDAIISLADVEAVLGLDFFQRGTVYFDGVWNQASDSDHQTVLRAMARRPEPWSLPELESATRLSPDALSAALRWAERHDILRASKESLIWDFHVPLMRRWVSERRDA